MMASRRNTKSEPDRGSGCAKWPKPSYACAVLRSQVPEVMENVKRRGVPTDFTKSGEPIFTSRDHRKRYMQAMGFFDRDAGYGDAPFTGTCRGHFSREEASRL